jgi:hypothetical protein
MLCSRDVFGSCASVNGWVGLIGLFDHKSALAVTMPIVTAFKFRIGHNKNGLLNR